MTRSVTSAIVQMDDLLLNNYVYPWGMIETELGLGLYRNSTL